MRDHRMLAPGDHVLVGLSGGKDSMILLEVLKERIAALPFEVGLSAAHIEAGGIGYTIDRKGLSGFCHSLDVALHFEQIAVNPAREPGQREAEEAKVSGPQKKACFICSWHRRKALFTLGKTLRCNKLALGHHRNDAVETLLMNMIYHGSISSLPHKLRMFDGRIELIRPLLDLDERLLGDYAERAGLVKIEKHCPHEDQTKRTKMRELMHQIEALHGQGSFNTYKSMSRIFPEYLPGVQKGE